MDKQHINKKKEIIRKFLKKRDLTVKKRTN